MQEAVVSSVTFLRFPTQGDHNDSYALLGELAPCGYDTSLMVVEAFQMSS